MPAKQCGMLRLTEASSPPPSPSPRWCAGACRQPTGRHAKKLGTVTLKLSPYPFSAINDPEGHWLERPLVQVEAHVPVCSESCSSTILATMTSCEVVDGDAVAVTGVLRPMSKWTKLCPCAPDKATAVTQAKFTIWRLMFIADAFVQQVVEYRRRSLF